MSLIKYKQKRNFKSTSEPKGEVKSPHKALHFVVQKHAASHLHYDLRLEMEGVLKSWAVPKGPSMNPKDKRLAMMVEDHPYDYKDFEGNIPEGNYGAGNVIVWDEGTYTDYKILNKKDGEKKLLSDLKKGNIKFILDGHKLKGAFTLVKIKGSSDNQWLLIKKQDKYVKETDILKKNKSVKSNMTLEQLIKKNTPAKSKVTKKKTIQKKSLVVKNSEPYDAMLAHIGKEPFDDSEWIFEVKYDGYRALAVINPPEDPVLYSRNHLSFNKLFKPVVDQLKKIKHTAVVDGEVVIEDDAGRSGFQLLQNYQKTGKGTLKYYVFDLLSLDGNDIRQLPLTERKELLQLLLKKYKLTNIIYSEHITGKGKDFYRKAQKKNQEGIMAKNANSPYRSGKRTNDWLKIKINQQEEAVIIGITEPQGSRSHFGAIVLGQYNNSRLSYIGMCGTGFTESTLHDLYRKFRLHFRKTSPLAETIKLRNKIQWIDPVYVCQVKFTEKTNSGQLRHPVYLGLRIDKTAGDVKMEPENKKSKVSRKEIKETKSTSPVRKDEKSTAKKSQVIRIGGKSLVLTNQDKIYFPEDGITKGDIVNYYREIADFILPYLKNRPQSLNRFPNGINGPSFYHKDMETTQLPSWAKTAEVYSESTGKPIDYLLCNDTATLVYMANLGCIEINPWNSRIQKPEYPDWLVIDLDPGKISFTEVVKTARMVKEVLDEFGAPSFCKTSGATGLHIYLPLGARYEYDIVKQFAELIAVTVNARLPDITSIERTVSKRKNKIYIDFLQNRRGQTLAAPYSARPRKGATVSTPLDWSEVNNKLNPGDFTIKNIFRRLDKKGDLWAPVIGKGINLDKLLRKMTEG